AAPAPRARPLVLLADDDLTVRALVRVALEPLGCDIVEAEDGEEALEVILADEPDLVVLDVMMPGLTGWEITRYVREREGCDDILILMLTAVGVTVNALTAPLYGADRHLDKPFDLDEMTRVAGELLAQRRSRLGRARR
ncbi:MAG: response regulator, partial [Deltaproteobacteria bacterium]|nr:response regulator [Deltaproteobacteria bacterium]